MPKRSKTWDLFLSYSSADRQKADAIIKDLESAGLRVWYDFKEIIGGDRIRERIADGIRNSKAVLILASASSLKSKWVLNELDAAMMREIEERRKIVIPVLLGNIEVSDLPSDIQGKNHIDLRYRFKDRYAKSRITILNSLQSISEPARLGLIEIPLGEDAIRYVLAYRYVAAREQYLLDDVFIEALVDVFIKDRRGKYATEVKTYKKKFLLKYGRWGARQLLTFFLDHSELSLTRGFTEEELNGLFQGMEVFLAMLDAQQQTQQQGSTIIMGVQARKNCDSD
jgi:TIR domain